MEDEDYERKKRDADWEEEYNEDKNIFELVEKLIYENQELRRELNERIL